MNKLVIRSYHRFCLYRLSKVLTISVLCLQFSDAEGTVEGLNPLMFVFALVGNATYVARYGFSSSYCEALDHYYAKFYGMFFF